MNNEEVITRVTRHLQGMCETPTDITVTDIVPLSEGAQLVHFAFGGGDVAGQQGAVYYPESDLLLTPRDWQGVTVAAPSDIERVEWMTSSGAPAIVVCGLPGLFAAN